MPCDRERALHRAQLLLGADAMARIASAKVILFGAGGVGSWAAEALVRTGIGHLSIVDADVVCPTNVNRQAQATSLNAGMPKAGELRKRLLDIAPSADIVAKQEMYNADTCGRFDLKSYDYVLDAIDTIDCKILLLRRSLEAGVKVYSSMGAALRLDPTRIRVAPVSATKGCPLARVVRQRLRQEGVDASKITCVYSEEPVAANKGVRIDESGGLKSRVNGSLVQSTAPFGFTLAGLVVNDLAAMG